MYKRQDVCVVVDWLRLSLAMLPPLAATCAPLAELSVFVVVMRELFDWSRLSVADPPPLLATCAPEADVVLVFVERLALSVFTVERSA